MAKGAVLIEVTPQNDTNSCVGTLTFIDNSVNPQTGTILLRGQVPNPDLKLWSHQFVDVTIFAGVEHDAVMIPEGAVQFGKMGPYLFVAKDGKADMRVVKTGIRYKDTIQILEGVLPGESVVVLGQLMLFPGAPVAEAMNGAPQGQASSALGGQAATDGKDKDQRAGDKSAAPKQDDHAAK
jgi:multidrug efflux system membrane fusion protein